MSRIAVISVPMILALAGSYSHHLGLVWHVHGGVIDAQRGVAVIVTVGRWWPDLHPMLPLIHSLLVTHPAIILRVLQHCPTLCHIPSSSVDPCHHCHHRHRHPVHHRCHCPGHYALIPSSCLQMAADIWSSKVSIAIVVCRQLAPMSMWKETG